MKKNVSILFFGLFILSILTACSQEQAPDTEEPFQPKIEAYSMPHWAPMYLPPPYQLRDCHAITVVFISKMEVLNKLVPPPLVPNQDGIMFFYIGNHNAELHNELVPYLETIIGVPVTYEDKSGDYCAVLYLDPAFGIMPGREIWGSPKKDADIVYQETKDKIFAQVSRLGTVIAELSANLGSEVQPIPEEPPTTFINLKIIPSALKGAPPDVMQLTSLVVTDVVKKSERPASEVSLKFHSTTEDPLGEIPVLNVVWARFTTHDALVEYGEVLYDYQTNRPAP